MSDSAKSMNLDELQGLFRQFNALYFESQLQICSIEYGEDLEECSAGRWDPPRILIREGLCDSQQRITLLHEMIRIRINGHGADFQAELARCADKSLIGFREEILSERQRVKDFNRFGTIGRNTWIEMELERLATELPRRPWAGIRQSVLEASLLCGSEFAEIEEWISEHWDWLNDPQRKRPSAPAVGKQKCSV